MSKKQINHMKWTTWNEQNVMKDMKTIKLKTI
jgi:hypothetical protein